MQVFFFTRKISKIIFKITKKFSFTNNSGFTVLGRPKGMVQFLFNHQLINEPKNPTTFSYHISLNTGFFLPTADQLDPEESRFLWQSLWQKFNYEDAAEVTTDFTIWLRKTKRSERLYHFCSESGKGFN